MVNNKLVISDVVEDYIYNAQGETIYTAIVHKLKEYETIEISLINIDVMSSSFLNSAVVPLTERYDFEEFKSRIKFVNGQPHINKLIVDRVKYAYS